MLTVAAPPSHSLMQHHLGLAKGKLCWKRALFCFLPTWQVHFVLKRAARVQSFLWVCLRVFYFICFSKVLHLSSKRTLNLKRPFPYNFASPSLSRLVRIQDSKLNSVRNKKIPVSSLDPEKRTFRKLNLNYHDFFRFCFGRNFNNSSFRLKLWMGSFPGHRLSSSQSRSVLRNFGSIDTKSLLEGHDSNLLCNTS